MYSNGRLARAALAASLCLVLLGCQTGPSRPGGGGAAARIRPATAILAASPEAVEEGFAKLKRNARAQRRQWEAKTFEEFERSVYKEPFEGGKYIVSGDMAIADRKQLQEFFETRIKREPPETAPGALIVHRAGGLDAIWNSTQRKQLTYCVSSAFAGRHPAVVASMQAATGAWEEVGDVDFIYVASQDSACTASNGNVVFDVRPVNVNGEYLARAFFPNEPRAARNVLIDQSSFELEPGRALTLTGILRHELGHSLGWRHEHTRPESGTCFEDEDWRPLTEYDRFSVMHYPQCNGGGDWSLTLTKLDKNGAACAYGPAPGFPVDPQICPSPSRPPVAVQTKLFDHERVTRDEEKAYGPFTVSPGSRFEARMIGDGMASGDPDLYVRFGEAPARAGGSFACRPYTSGADEACSLDVPAGQSRAFVMVHGYAAGAYGLTIVFSSGQP
jgi:hypothetical protein